MTKDNGVISFEKVIISSNEIKKMLPREKKRYLMLTNILRDLNLIQKLLLFVKHSDKKEAVLKSADITMSFFFLKTLISKNHEMWEFIKRNNIVDEKNQFSRELKSSLTLITNFFKDQKISKLFGFIRNKFGFHYEYQADVDPLINEAMDSFPRIEMWLSMESGNDIFASSNGIMMEVIFRKMERLGFNGGNKELMNKLFDLTLRISRLFEGFSKNYLIEIILKNAPFHSEEKVEVKVPLLSKVDLPLVVKNV